MVRINENRTNNTTFSSNTAFQKNVISTRNPFTPSFKGQTSPIADVFAKSGTEKFKAEVAPIKGLLATAGNFMSKQIAQVDQKYKISAAVKSLASSPIFTKMRAKMLNAKPVTTLSEMLQSKIA